MKTLQDLFEIQGQAVATNKKDFKTWFFSYSGHVNKLSIRFFFTGWSSESTPETLEVSLDDEDGINAGYWFIKSKM